MRWDLDVFEGKMVVVVARGCDVIVTSRGPDLILYLSR